ncbi:proline hydroxylase [Arenicella chitinivorans]|uniref:Proline hydroxylase n=1 Tax=Arenicella chitinivorans TaxID=1329800 RepID=A0A918RW07_9GAMM|nr:2OG-Fe(II) oxygenase family protein [Arenicella chitinivorans]GHA11397.1 proline hydroxylase [Arenicella chitinivorans]
MPNLFTEEAANAIHRTLQHETPWHLAYSGEAGTAHALDAFELETLSEQEESAIYQDVYSRASDEYQFIYKFYPIINAILRQQLDEQAMLYQIATFLNSSEFLNYARALTKDKSLVKMNPSATCYQKGHFLNIHDDFGDKREANPSGQRKYAVVFNFCPHWSPNWGGGTNFFNGPNENASETWYPGFNTMTLFRVPVLHSVSPVAPFVNANRYSITGWLRSDPAIARPDLD